MNNLILIGAIGKNNELGCNNKLIWYIPEDLKFFKDNTINHTIVMGYNTFLSLPKLLSGRKHIVLTRKNIKLPSEVLVFHDKESVLNYVKNNNEQVYVIGGESIYKQFIDYSDRMILTEIEDSFNNADTFFPKFNLNEWNKEILSEHEYNKLYYKHVLYKRKK
ncbi:MAG: dihydrofolate reductase [Bacilli bacterium]|nr:dihydrofolate reductase [Bacilli bacterium]